MISSVLLAVAIVAHEPGYTTSLANHIQRWLASESVMSRVIAPAEMPTALAKEKIAFLVGFSAPTAGEIASLRQFSGRGGKLVVFHSSAPALAAMMGVKPLGYKTASYPGQWSRMVFSGASPSGFPSSILQTSSVLQRAVPANANGRVIATWVDRNGKSTGEAAWISTQAGFWMTHVLQADGDEALKAQLLGAIVGWADPGLWSVKAHHARQVARHNATVAYAKAQVPRAGEIHAVWDHTGFGLYPGDWPRTMRVLREARVTDLFVNVAGAGFAFYPSDVLPRAKAYEQEGDQLAACLAAARGQGIRIHAWIVCFGTYRATPDRMQVFASRGWRLKTPAGKLTDYLDPGNPAVRQYVLSAIGELQSRYPIHGIHLDYVRYGDAAAKPKNAALAVSQFVSEARHRVKRPKWLTAAVYGKYPNCIGSVGQDWVGWVDMNAVDYVVPMDYCESNAKLEELLKQHASRQALAQRTIVGLGITANESRLDARKTIEQINLSRRYGMAGNALFDLDTTLEKSVLPYLKLGVW